MAADALSRRLGPASRLVPVVAAGKLRHARPRALRRGADPRLRARPRRATKMSKSLGNIDLAAGRRQEERRRHPAPLGGLVGLSRRICASARTSSSRTSTPIAGCATRCASARQPGRASARASASRRPRCRSWSATCCTASPSSTRVVRDGLRRLRLQARCSRRCSISAPSICRRSISTSARTRSIATRRRRCAAAPAARCWTSCSTA